MTKTNLVFQLEGKLTKKPSSILTLFAKQAKKNDDKQEAELEKEERLDRKRRQEIRWTEKRDHHARLRWAKGWLLEKVVLQAEQEGHQQVLERAGELARELVESAINKSEKERDSKLRRLELARNQRAKLLVDLENWWSILEEGVPDLETERETHTFQRGRRERD